MPANYPLHEEAKGDLVLPARGVARGLGRVLAGTYARWCVRQMLRDAQRH
jgi:hypothetical protein